MQEIKSRINNEICEGLIVICDPHLTSIPPSSRQDDYMNVVHSKMEKVIQLGNSLNLLPLICGDVFHRPVENSEIVKNKIIDLFYESKYIPVIIPGNHDLSSAELSRKDSLYTLKSSRSCIVGIKSGPLAKIQMLGHENVINVGIGGTPYGQAIPDHVDWDFQCDYGIWMTHHNLPFSSVYKEQAVSNFKEIQGVDEVFNGHLHHEATDVKKGNTNFHNLGSITRTKKDEADRTPCVTIWKPDTSGCERIELKGSMTDHAFKLTGRLSAKESIIKEAGESGKRFVDFLVNGNRKDIDIDDEFDKMYRSGHIDSKVHHMLQELSSLAKKEVER